MAKVKKRRKGKTKTRRRSSDHFVIDLSHLAVLSEPPVTPEDIAELEWFARKYPRLPPVLQELLNGYFEIGNLLGYQRVCRLLIELGEGDAELAFALAGVYMENEHFILALQAFRDALKRFPEAEKAQSAGETLARLEEALPKVLKELNLEGEDGFECALLHEEVQAATENNELQRARQAAEELLRRRPGYRAALNNLTQIDIFEGKHAQAIERTRALLEREPENVHARSNIVRLQLTAGQLEEARRSAEGFARGDIRSVDHWIVIAEAWSALGEWERVLEAFAGCEATKLYNRKSRQFGMLWHYKAVAEARLGDKRQAYKAWKNAQKAGFDHALVRMNLDDLDAPPGEQQGAWPAPLSYWVGDETWTRIQEMISKVQGSQGGNLKKYFKRLVADEPRLKVLASILLERGDPTGRFFAVTLALFLEDPELDDALHKFVLGPWGPDDMRLMGLDGLAKKGVIPREPVRMWIEGEQRKTLPMSFEVFEEAEEKHTPQVHSLIENAMEALGEGQKARAESMYKQALLLAPKAPDLHYNLGVVYEAQRRFDEAEAMIRRSHELDPKYLFARVAIAMKLAGQKDLLGARALFEPVLECERLHVTEAVAVCRCGVVIASSAGETELANAWLDLWERIVPEDSSISRFRKALHKGWVRRRLWF